MLITDLPDDLLKYLFTFLLLPKQIIKLKSVCKNWARLIGELLNQRPYLLLDVTLLTIQHRRVVMAMAPVNSSGDIYHMLAFVILSLKRKAQMPPILLTYDQEPPKVYRATQTEITTGLQVARSLAFISSLGYEDCFFRKTLPFSSGQPAPRQATLEAKLAELQVTHYIDHRFSTSVIAEHFRQFGFEKVTAALREGFRQRNVNFLPKVSVQKVSRYVAARMRELADIATNGLPLIVIHYRISGKSNSDQDLSNIVKPTIKSLKAKGYNVATVYVDSRLKGFSASTIAEADINIRPFQDTTLLSDQEDLGKLAHLEFLLHLYDNKDQLKLCGIIGNTSGTLDLAAFIGHRVFNIHHFDYPKFDYQDYRVLLQMCFFSVERDDTDRDTKLLQDIEAWAQGQPPIVQLKQHLSLATPTSFGGVGKKGFAFFSSVMDMASQNWNEQSFFQALRSHVNKECKQANFLTLDYSPPSP
ncbi:MAG: hypothetical protein K0S08_1390 [Gammaproteobacteria bacterium]|jgi:hypothetical protein|nr:hypothetical protein [Gammaproteobacteria bacterium]